MNRATWMLALAGLAACNGRRSNDDLPDLLDTGWFEQTETGVDPDKCEHKLVSWTPEDGAQNVYWRDLPVVSTASDATHAYYAWLETADGERINTRMDWGASNLQFTLTPTGPIEGETEYLEADTNYVMGLQDCAETRYVSFRTGPLGAPFTIDTGDLSGRTYLIDLQDANWVEPPTLGAVIAQEFTTPILVGIRHADATRIDLLGAPGLVNPVTNEVSQDTSTATWDFPITDFTSAPYLDAQAAFITLRYSSIDIPVEDFLLQVTFSADGTALGGGVISGMADTRNLHELLGGGGESVICDTAAGLGINCQPCADGQPFCLRLRGSDIEGALVPGLVLNQIN